MLTLDLKSRFRNKTFILSMLGAIVLLIQQLGFKDLIPSNWVDIVNTILSILVMLGIVIDTSTPGVSDKTQHVEENNSDIIDPVEENVIDTEAILKENETLKATLSQVQSAVANNTNQETSTAAQA
ncbi:bacteriophage holin [Clostridium puniceum]|uniref:Bacteriophage holin n=1 Tax=Clostridium puniceum TaxID=29367 RepID=A0A1S8TXR4_9CLOT|nr:phage holin [Clostridium puniceum]OOM82504.1 bacteriophage holin [Clostridium puniceum]